MAKVKKAGKPVEAKEEAKVGKSTERSYKSRLIFGDKATAIDIPIRWNKLQCKDIDEAYPIIYRDVKGNEVRNKSWVEGKVLETGEDREEGWLTATNKTSQNKFWTTFDGKQVLDEVKAYQIVEGKEILVEKLKKSEEFKVLTFKDLKEYDEWMPEASAGLYKVWAETPQDVYSLGQFIKKYLLDKNQFAVIKVAVGNSYKEYYGLLKAIEKDGKFGITMKLSRVRIDWDKDGFMEFLNDKPADVAPKTKPKTILEAL